MAELIVTNNPRVESELKEQKKIEITYLEGATQQEILRIARDKIHLGAKLVIHPMMGRIKPHETPYKSIFLKVPDGLGELDYNSLLIIEESISETSKLLNNTFKIKYDEATPSMLSDLAYIDYLLIKSGIDEHSR